MEENEEINEEQPVGNDGAWPIAVEMLTTANHIPDLRQNMQIVSLAHCTTAEYQQEPDNKILLSMLLKVSHHTTSKEKHKFNSQGNHRTTRGNLRVKFVGEMPSYDRAWLLADASSSSGELCMLFTTTPQESKAFMKRFSMTDEGVGHVFCLVEIEPIIKYMGETTSVALVESSPIDCLPVTNNPTNIMQVTPMVKPPVDCSKYYCYKNMSIAVNRVTIANAFCSGYLCDQQQSDLTPNQKCGCVYTPCPGVSSRVLTFDVSWNTNYQVSPSTGRTTVRQFRSRNTTELFVKNGLLDDFDEDARFEVMRSSAQHVVAYINNHGGWTIIGWTRSGAMKDKSGDGNDTTVDSLNLNAHISYLYPSDVTVVESPDFIALQLSIDNVT